MRLLRRWMTAFAAAGAIFLASPAAHADSLEPGNAGGMCLDFGAGEGRIARCNGGGYQDIQIPYGGTGQLRVGRNCVAVGNEGQPLYLAKCKNRNEQSWYLDQSGSLVNGNGLCADVEGGKRGEGTRVIGYRCNGKSNQRWATNGGGGYPQPGPGPGNGGNYQTSLLSPQHAYGMCLDVRGGGNDLIIYGCHGKNNQRFSFTTRGETEIQVGGNCVTAPGSTNQSLYVARCTGSYQQRWSFASDGTIRSASGQCADVYDGRSNEGTSVILYKCSGKANQRWNATR